MSYRRFLKKSLKSCVGILFFSSMVLANEKISESVKLKYPRVVKIFGKVLDMEREGSLRNLKIGDVLKGKSYIDVSSAAQIQIDLDPKNSITVMDESQLKIPVINLENGEVVELILLKGKMRVLSLDQNERYFSTPITRDVYANADFILQYDTLLAKTTLTVFRGNLEFRGFENDISMQVGTGERAAFIGVLEEGEPSFDILLKGRKVARGKLSKSEVLPEKEVETFRNSVDVKKTKVANRIKMKIPLKPGQICEEPNAMLNECSWVCEGLPKKSKIKITKCDVQIKGVECVRRRCDANGRWSDAFILPNSQQRCTLMPEVGLCDY